MESDIHGSVHRNCYHHLHTGSDGIINEMPPRDEMNKVSHCLPHTQLRGELHVQRCYAAVTTRFEPTTLQFHGTNSYYVTGKILMFVIDFPKPYQHHKLFSVQDIQTWHITRATHLVLHLHKETLKTYI